MAVRGFRCFVIRCWDSRSVNCWMKSTWRREPAGPGRVGAMLGETRWETAVRREKDDASSSEGAENRKRASAGAKVSILTCWPSELELGSRSPLSVDTAKSGGTRQPNSAATTPLSRLKL